MPRQIAVGIEGGSPPAQQHPVKTMNQNWGWCLQAAPTRLEWGLSQTQETSWPIHAIRKRTRMAAGLWPQCLLAVAGLPIEQPQSPLCQAF